MARNTTTTDAPVMVKLEETTDIDEAACSTVSDDPEAELPRRRDLLVEAIRIVRAALKKEATPSRTTVGNLVQLLKLHKDLVREEEMPTQIQLIWNELDEDLYGNG